MKSCWFFVMFVASSMLGHGEKDCEANEGDNPATRRYSDKLRGSPWKANRGDGDSNHAESMHDHSLNKNKSILLQNAYFNKI